MKPSPENPGQDDLSNLLQEWRADAALPPGFHAAVWARIDQRESAQHPESKSFPAMVAEWFSQLVPRPQFAAVFIAMFAMAGLTAGWTQGRKEVSRAQERLAEQYVQAVNPYHASPR